MRKVSDAVRSVVQKSPQAYLMLKQGHLNLSSYAGSISREVESHTKKDVRQNTIVASLARLRKEIQKDKPLLPRVVLDDIAAKAGLIEISFEKTKEALTSLQAFSRKKAESSAFFMITQGIGEITLIAPEQWETDIQKLFSSMKPKIIVRNLASLTIRFSEKYMTEPNTFYALLTMFAMERMPIVEMVSTFTEITFVLEQRHVERAFSILHSLLISKS
ncbi:hypothetical protein FJZ28_02050 [Candidatus Peregrinibacteria bacterium]|nr:hypothetical protein [Candidatus Peregrinibacteria bacterium]